MLQPNWSVNGSDGSVHGHKFVSSNDGIPMLVRSILDYLFICTAEGVLKCSMVCRSMGRHAHIDFCRSENAEYCSGADLQHIPTAMTPEPSKPKDLVSHSLFWKRTGIVVPFISSTPPLIPLLAPPGFKGRSDQV